jgi:non-specific serine/threonine protein kinase/serine/threonine-protein kinase
MSPEKYERLKELFNQALELETGKREKWVNEIEDVELRGELTRLIRGDKSAGDTLEHSPFSAVLPRYEAGAVIGNYKLVKELGRGGMGSVFLAERNDLHGRQAALKIIRSELDSAELLRRFHTEREILAALEHPNIASLYDSGTTESGLPYFVMEYVEGEDIGEYCSRAGLSLEERIELFRKVCSAVAYAHSRLIVHRDLKPSNILVTKDGEPKLLDFGIAKFATPENADQPGTATALGMMTPSYASPEQLRGETVGTATDIYSLGVILFELLTGSLPYDITGKRIDEIVRAVCETEPERPSSVVSGSFGPNARTAKDLPRETNENKKRGQKYHPAASAKMLRGDIDNILLKALRKEPERRYATVDQFSDDLRRHLEGLPVTARPDTFSYRASKFVKRNRTAVVGSGLVAAALVAGVVGTTWQAIKAERERSVAEERFNDVRAIANNVVFKYAEELQKISGTTKVQEMLITDAIEYLDKLSKDAAGNVELSRELAKAYLKIGDLQGGISGASGTGAIGEGIDNIKKAVAILENAAKTSDDAGLLADLRDAYSDLGQTLARAGDDDKTKYLQLSLDTAERLLKADPTNIDHRLSVATGRLLLADVTPDDEMSNMNKGDVYFGNRKMYLKAAEMIDQILAEQPGHRKALERKVQVDSRISGGYQMEADAQRQFGNDAKFRELGANALKFAVSGREAAEKVLALDPDDFDWQYNAAAIRWNESLIEALLGNYDEALAIQNEQIINKEKWAAADPNNADTAHGLAIMYDGIAATYVFKKDFATALEIQQKGISLVESLVHRDPNNIEFIQSRRDLMMNHAANLQNLGRYDDAIAAFRRSLELYKNSPLLKDKPAETAYYEGLVNERLGNVYKEQADRNAAGRTAKILAAADAFRKAIAIWEKPLVTEAFFASNREQIDAVRKKLSECQAALK